MNNKESMTMAELEERALFQLAMRPGKIESTGADVTSMSLGILPLFDFSNLPLQYVDREKAFLEWYRANRYQCIVI